MENLRKTVGELLLAIVGAIAFFAAFCPPGRAQEKSDPSVLLGQIRRTPEREARGKYLVDGLLWCEFCHSTYDFTKRPATSKPGTEGGGLVFDSAYLGLPSSSRVVASNISSDPEFGAGKWKDSDIVRALRKGIGHDGRTLFPAMPYADLCKLSDEDLAAVITYLRALLPVHVQQPQTRLADEIKSQLQPLPPVDHVPEPNKVDRVSYGKYLVTVARCEFCHTARDEHGRPLPGFAFAGGFTFSGPYSADGSTFAEVTSLNLTPDPSGISYFDEAMFIKSMRDGAVGARSLSTVMPWSMFRNLSDDDLKTIFAYLQSLAPIKHRVDNTEPPTYCKICRGKHGLGNLN